MDARYERRPLVRVVSPDSEDGHYLRRSCNRCTSNTATTTTRVIKREICNNFWVRGTCKYGSSCIFAHEYDDKRMSSSRPPLASRRSVGDENMVRNSVMDGRDTKPVICRYYMSRGNCPYQRSAFSHERSEKCEQQRDSPVTRGSSYSYQRSERCERDNSLPRGSSAISIKTIKADSDANPWLRTIRADSNANPWLKTRLCHRWRGPNTCPYGSKCTYAHGRAELRRLDPALEREAENTWTASRYLSKNDYSYTASEHTEPEDREFPTECSSIKWKTMKKMVSIYADWIDEEYPMPSSG